MFCVWVRPDGAVHASTHFVDTPDLDAVRRDHPMPDDVVPVFVESLPSASMRKWRMVDGALTVDATIPDPQKVKSFEERLAALEAKVK